MKRLKSKGLRRGFVGTGCLLLAAVFMVSPWVKSENVRAVDSLPYVEEIISSKTDYNILEIVPSAGLGSVGYYVSGSEPCANWAKTLAAVSGSAARKTAANTLFTQLTAAGILSGGSTTPLTYTYKNGSDYYTENTYWGLGGSTSGWTKLTLDAFESTSVTGTFTSLPDNSGAYKRTYTYNIAANGGYSQNIAFVTYAPADMGAGYYYYAPLESEDPAVSAWVKIENMTTDLTPLLGKTAYIYTSDKDAEGNVIRSYYAAAGILGHMEMDVDQTYYWLDMSKLGMPSSTYSPQYCYAVSSAVGWTADANGNFSRQLDGYEFVGTGGDYSFTPGSGETQRMYYREVYYQGGFANNQWFLSGVFDLDLPADQNKLAVHVNSVTPSKVTSAMVSSADLVVVSAGFDPSGGTVSDYAASNDLTDTLAYALAEQFYQLKPVIVDYRVAASAVGTNVRKLAQFALGGSVLNGATTFAAINVSSWNAAGSIAATDADKNFVKSNVYCYKPDAAAPAFAASSFLTDFGTAKTSAGFSDALSEIQSENFYREVAGLSAADMLNNYVCMATAVRYIINYMGQRGAGSIDHVRVLDIEPAAVRSGALTVSTVRGWLGLSTSSPVTVTITTMATGEFIGKIEDINENYDLIYFGSNVSGMNTISGATVYNDPDMPGLIYSHVGDLYRSGLHLTGLLDRDYTDASCSTVYNGSDTDATLFRFSGNDITEAKSADLVEFAAAGYPIVIADNLLTASRTVDTTRVDNSSFLYGALNQIRTRSNVLRVSSVSSGTLLRYLEVSKPSISLISQPTVYVDSDSTARLTAESDGYYYLNYSFQVENDTEPTPQATTYDCRLYIDLNADGRYATEERLNDIEVFNSAGKPVLPQTSGGVETYQLHADTVYTVRRQMPGGYVGIIPWKLEIVKNGAAQVHASATNYARIAASVKQDLNILQIADSNKGTSLIDLESQLSSGTVYYKNSSGATATAPYRGIYGALIGQLSDFNVRIITVEADDLESMTGLNYYNNAVKTAYARPATVDSAAIYAYLDKFHMLIIGFADMYGEIGTNSAAAITQYIDSRRSVLFTHDTTSFSNLPYANFPTSTVRNVTENIPLRTWSTNNATVTPTNATIAPTANFGSLLTGGVVYQNPYLISQYRVKVNRIWYWYDYTYTLSLTVNNYQNGSNIRVGIDGTSYSAPVPSNGIVTISNITIPYDDNYHIYIEGDNGTLTVSNISLTRYGNGSPSSIPLNTSSWSVSGNVSLSGSTIYFYKPTTRYGYIYQQLSLSPGTYVLSGSVSSLTDANSISLGATDNNYLDNYQYISSTGDVSVTFSISSPRTIMLYVDGYYGTVAFSNITLTKQPGSGSNGTVGDSWWGYNFNTIIRDAVGLDRFGITSTLLRPYLRAGNGNTLLTPDSLSESVRNALNQHDIAYKSESANANTVPEVQGFTNYELIRYGSSSYKYTNNTYSTRETTTVSQVNKGQITTYPYNINTMAFGGTDSSLYSSAVTPYMKVGNTHEQYYQVNMAADDIVVWYCLSSGNNANYYYNDVPNDVTNAYYIYSKGNVTYSGVGHSDKQYNYTSDSSSDVVSIEYVNEAKLFVNTMIAAFQSSMQSPSISFRDSSSASSMDLKAKYFTIEYNNSGAASNLLEGSLNAVNSEESRALYFKIADPNLTTQNKTITIQYYYHSGTDTDVAVTGIDETVTAFTPGNAPASPRSGVTYRILLPATSGPLAALADNDTPMVRLYLRVTTQINTQSLSGSDSIALRKIGLFDLN